MQLCPFSLTFPNFSSRVLRFWGGWGCISRFPVAECPMSPGFLADWVCRASFGFTPLCLGAEESVWGGLPASVHGLGRCQSRCFSLMGRTRVGDGVRNAVRCDGVCSALRWRMQRAAVADAACCMFLRFSLPCRPSAAAPSWPKCCCTHVFFLHHKA